MGLLPIILLLPGFYLLAGIVKRAAVDLWFEGEAPDRNRSSTSYFAKLPYW